MKKITQQQRGILFLCSALLLSSGVHSETTELGTEHELDRFKAWFEENQEANIEFQDGDVIEYQDREKIRAFIPPGFQDEVLFDGMSMTLKKPTDLSPSEAYKEATVKYQDKVTLKPDGGIENFVAGEPFDSDSLSADDPMAGYKAAWNFIYRWQGQGFKTDVGNWIWVRKGGNHDNHELKRTHPGQFEGGGTFERTLKGPYIRAYLTHRADLPDHRIEGNWVKDTLYREITEFDQPFDIAGTAFLIQRYNNTAKSDDAWAYIPSMRRVRRISTEVRNDSLLGTDHTLEDFYCFAGRVLDYDWEYLGKAKIFSVARSRNLKAHYYGPNGWAPNDQWELRTVNVYLQYPKSDSNSYSVKVQMTDSDNNDSLYCNAYDRGGKLWKIWYLTKAWTEDFPEFQKLGTPKNSNIMGFQSLNVIDKQNGRGTLVPCEDISYPQSPISELRNRLDINYLTRGK